MEIGQTIADANLQDEGIWVPYEDDGEFLIAYAGRKKYRDKLGKLQWKARNRNRGRDLSASANDEVTSEAMLDTVLLNWRGWTKGGEPFPFNRENAKWLLTNSDKVRDFIWVESNTLSNFQSKNGEDQEVAADPLAETKSGSEVPAGTG